MTQQRRHSTRPQLGDVSCPRAVLLYFMVAVYLLCDKHLLPNAVLCNICYVMLCNGMLQCYTWSY
jgi:hypothetical protein